MHVNIRFPWNRTALIGQLARSCQEEGHLGRTTLMKLLYFLQEVRGVRLGYEFSLYNYGPFDSQVLSDLDTAEVFAAVKVSIRHSGGYQIDPGDELERAEEFAKEFLTESRDRITEIVEHLGDKSAKELELLSTVHFVWRDLREKGDAVSIGRIVERVGSLKPDFTPGDIESAIAELDGLRYLEN